MRNGPTLRPVGDKVSDRLAIAADHKRFVRFLHGGEQPGKVCLCFLNIDPFHGNRTTPVNPRGQRSVVVGRTARPSSARMHEGFNRVLAGVASGRSRLGIGGGAWAWWVPSNRSLALKPVESSWRVCGQGVEESECPVGIGLVHTRRNPGVWLDKV